MIALNATGDGAHFRLRLFDADARFEPPDEIGSVQEATRQLRFSRLIRQPEVSGYKGKLKVRRQYSDNRITGAVDCQRLPDDPCTAAEHTPPQSVGQHGHSFRSRVVFAGSKRAADDRLDSHHRKEIRRRRRSHDEFRFATSGQKPAVAPVGGDLFKNPVLLIVLKIGVRKLALRKLFLRRGLPEVVEPFKREFSYPD